MKTGALKVILFLLIIITPCLLLKGQSTIIEGVITQPDSTTAFPGVSVYLENTKFITTTNGKGNFIINGVPAGNYTLVASSIGYHSFKKQIDIQPGQSLKIDLSMREAVLDLPAVVIQSVTMTGGNYGIKDIPGSAHYISPKEIQKFSYTDINRTLRSVPGINLQEEDGFGLRPNIGLRGTGVERSSKITIMEDGILIAPAPYASPAAYYFPTIGRMQAVEVLKGSSQIKYGPFTTGGAINLISTQIPDEFSGKIYLTGGSFGGRNIHTSIGNSHKNFGYMVESYQFSSNGFKQLDGGGNTGFDKKDFLAKFRVNTNTDAKIYQSITFKAGQAVETSNETYLGLTGDDFTKNPSRRYSASQKDLMTTEQTQFSVTHTAQLTSFLDITTTGYRTDFHRNWYKLDVVKDSLGKKTSISSLLADPAKYYESYNILTGTTSANSDALFIKGNNRTYYSQGVQTLIGINFTTQTITHKIDLGFRYHSDEADRYQNEDQYKMSNGIMQLTKAGQPGTESNRIENAGAVATFIQYKIRYKNFTAIPGLRYENISLQEKDYGKNDPARTGTNIKESKNRAEVFIPGIGLDYKINKHISAFTGVHKGFAPPGSKSESKPEESINYEAGTRYTANGISGQLVGFYNDYANLLGSDLAAAGGSGSGALFNGGKAESKGAEFQITYDLLFSRKSTINLPFTVVYTFTDAVFKSDFKSDFEDWGSVEAGDHLPYLASNQFTFILSAEHRNFNFNLSGKYMDEMRTNAGHGDIPANEKTDAFLILDASANYLFSKNVSLFGNITNIADKVYVVARRPSGLRPGMPRTFNVGVKVNF